MIKRELPAIEARGNADLSLRVRGEGSGRVTAVQVAGIRGEWVLDGINQPLLLHAHHPWKRAGYDVYQAVSIGQDQLHLLWLYCVGDALEHVYFESTDGLSPLQSEPLRGRCEPGASIGEALVTLPATRITLRALEGATVHGPRLQFEQRGSVLLGDHPFEVVPFAEVDCTDGCGPEGWRELHVALLDGGARTCFAVMYFGLNSERVLTTHGLCLPDLQDPVRRSWHRAAWRLPDSPASPRQLEGPQLANARVVGTD